MARRPNYSFERRQRELAKAAKKEAKRDAQREAVERRRAGETDDAAPESAESNEPVESGDAAETRSGETAAPEPSDNEGGA